MATEPSAAALLVQAEQAWAGGHGSTATALYERAAAVGEELQDLRVWALAVLGLARGQRYNVNPGLLPVRLHAVYEAVDEPTLRCRLAQVDGGAVVLPQHRDQPIRLTGDLVDDGAEIRSAYHDIVEPHLPDCRGPGIDQRGGGVVPSL